MTDNLTMRELSVSESLPLENPNPARLALNMESVEGAKSWAEVSYYHRR